MCGSFTSLTKNYSDSAHCFGKRPAGEMTTKDSFEGLAIGGNEPLNSRVAGWGREFENDELG